MTYEVPHVSTELELLRAEIELIELSDQVDYMMRRPHTDAEEFERLNVQLAQRRFRLRQMYAARAVTRSGTMQPLHVSDSIR